MKDSYLNDEFFSRLEALAFNLRKDLGGFFGGGFGRFGGFCGLGGRSGGLAGGAGGQAQDHDERQKQCKHLFHFDFAPFLMYELDWTGLRRVLVAAVQNKKEALSAEQSLLLTYEENTGLIRTASHFGYGN